MASPPPSPHLITRLWPVLPLLILRVVRLPNRLVPLASLVSQSPPPSPSIVNGYKLRRGEHFLPYPPLAKVSKWTQSKTVRHDRFKDLYLRDFVQAGKMVWRDRFRNVESTHFQEEMMARGLVFKHLEVDPVPEVADTCLGVYCGGDG